jgi:hypothetical protein
VKTQAEARAKELIQLLVERAKLAIKAEFSIILDQHEAVGDKFLVLDASVSKLHKIIRNQEFQIINLKTFSKDLIEEQFGRDVSLLKQRMNIFDPEQGSILDKIKFGMVERQGKSMETKIEEDPLLKK